MADIRIRKEGRVGRITLNRPDALNALTYKMCLEIEAALDAWANDPDVAMLLLDGEGDRAFCAGGDIAEMYAAIQRKDYAYGQRFWRDEYRMNAKMFEFPKPVTSLLQGFTMGGGVGVGCHGSHRIVCESSRIAMPECHIGLVPDVGGSLLLAQAPGRVGEYLGTTARRMAAADAIYAGFADYFIPQDRWPELVAELVQTGNWKRIDDFGEAPPAGTLEAMRPDIDRNFGGETMGDIMRALEADNSPFADDTLKALKPSSPFSLACTIELLHRLRGSNSIRQALRHEFRYTYRSFEHSDFGEGVRALIIDKDKNPRWRHGSVAEVPSLEVTKMLMPLDAAGLKLEEELA